MVVRLKSHKNYFKSNDTNNGNNFYLHVQIGEVVCRMNFTVVHTNGYDVLLPMLDGFLKKNLQGQFFFIIIQKPLNR
jgi:hypothetical protein